MAKWLSAAKPGTEESRKDKEVKGKERGRTGLDPVVKSLRDRFEVAGEAEASQMESYRKLEQDPDLCLDHGERDGTAVGHRMEPGKEV